MHGDTTRECIVTLTLPLPLVQAQQASGGSRADLDTLSEALFRQLVTGAGASAGAAAAPILSSGSAQEQRVRDPADCTPTAPAADR